MSTAEPTIALVFSPESWVEQLHRHLADHGGARVRQIVVEPSVALDEDYDALVVSDRWPALTRGFVDAVHARGRRVLGVFDPDEPAGKDHLVSLQVDATITADAGMTDFVDTVNGLARADDPGKATQEPTTPTGGLPAAGVLPSGQLVSVSGPRGSGVTEVALALAACDRRGTTVLVDAHESAPAIAVRLGLPLEPNLRAAVEARTHGTGELARVVARPRGVGFDVVAGFPSRTAAAQVTASEVVDVVGALRDSYRRVLLDVDGHADALLGRALVTHSDAVVGVGQGSPVGVARLVSWIVEARAVAPTLPLHVVVNRSPRDRFRRAEIAEEICRAVPPSTLAFVPTDRHVEDAGWIGEPVAAGPFATSLARVAAAVAPVSPDRRRRPPNRRRARR
jgi:MinD-like ATPase involved in chromosome partitioning or flagellar assembly